MRLVCLLAAAPATLSCSLLAQGTCDVDGDCFFGDLCVAGACARGGTEHDGGARAPRDAGLPDAGHTWDAGGDPRPTADGGGDEAADDGGGGLDASAPVDAGALLDAGALRDAGALLDAGALRDAGTVLDGSVPVDANDDGRDAAGASEGGVSDDGGGSPPPPLLPSCRAFRELDPGLPSGTYTIAPDGDDEEPVDVHCEMERAGGGWTRVVRFDAADSSCPAPWVQSTSPLGCRRSGAQIRSATFAAPLPSFEEVMGSVRAHAYGSNDAFFHGNYYNVGIDGAYVDGVSITVGNPRVHVWTLAAGIGDLLDGRGEVSASRCPCQGGQSSTRTFVGASWTCESPRTATQYTGNYVLAWDTADVLWDGADLATQCVGDADSASELVRALGGSATGPLEVRLMGNQDASDEDVALTFLELYVR